MPWNDNAGGGGPWGSGGGGQNNNNPWGRGPNGPGRGPNGGGQEPDLEELVRRFQQWLGGKGPRGGGRGGSGKGGSGGGVVGVVGALIVVGVSPQPRSIRSVLVKRAWFSALANMSAPPARASCEVALSDRDC